MTEETSPRVGRNIDHIPENVKPKSDSVEEGKSDLGSHGFVLSPTSQKTGNGSIGRTEIQISDDGMFNQREMTSMIPRSASRTLQERRASESCHPENLIRQCRVPRSVFGAALVLETSQKVSNKQLARLVIP